MRVPWLTADPGTLLSTASEVWVRAKASNSTAASVS